MFVGTHNVPRGSRRPWRLPGGDKSQHLIAYAGLAFLVAFRQSFGNSLTWKRVAMVFGLVALYGVIDELTQIPPARTSGYLRLVLPMSRVPWADWDCSRRLRTAVGRLAEKAAGAPRRRRSARTNSPVQRASLRDRAGRKLGSATTAFSAASCSACCRASLLRSS